VKQKIDPEYGDLFYKIQTGITDPLFLEKLEQCIFTCNEALTRFEDGALPKILDFLAETEAAKLRLIRTPEFGNILLNTTVLQLLESFDGKTNLRSIFEGIKGIKGNDLEFFLFPLVKHHNLLELENIATDIETKSSVFSLEGKFENLIRLIGLLGKNNLIELAGYSPTGLDFKGKIDNPGKINLGNRKIGLPDEFGPLPTTPGSPPRILLLGDSVGTNTVGLLYLASYLRRNGIEAYCQWNDPWGNKQILPEKLEELFNKVKPDIVGVSMKWFPHIARVLEICKTMKALSGTIKVVVGGDTATYYWEEIIQSEFIDYIILGDGELPLLKLCQARSEEEIPNFVYKKNGAVFTTPRTYVQTAASNSDIYLSDLDKIFVSPLDPYYTSIMMYIPTGKGCASNCFYCAGCMESQKRVFNRLQPHSRDIEAVRNDIRETKKYVGTFMYDFELPDNDLVDYYRKLWEGIDLSNHYCLIYFWELPSRELLELITKTYKYVHINVDLCSLSEPHRMKLTELKVVKPQPTDEELLGFLDIANQFENFDIHINLIMGLPCFSEADIEESKAVLSKLMAKYDRFVSLFWWRLHAQPGAPLTYEAEKYEMKSTARTFEDFLHYSQLNLDAEVYPDLSNLIYPLIHYQDADFESKIVKFCGDTLKKLLRYYYSRT
jgi:radical SAM superfamily enzyme YgiQ (UPF0313 family)